MKKKLLVIRAAKVATLSVCVVLLVSVASIGILLLLSLPSKSGTAVLEGLNGDVKIARDKIGVPTIEGKSRIDVVRSLGYTHAQERFFQMDMQRRRAAGELAEVMGSRALPIDKYYKIFRFRDLAERVVRNLPDDHLELLEAYVSGINHGLADLTVKPFEYFLLNVEPEPWANEDTILVAYSLYSMLQNKEIWADWTLGTMSDTLPKPVFDFFVNNGSIYESALDESKRSILAIPPKQYFSYLNSHDKETVYHVPPEDDGSLVPGSNAWTVSGKHTANGNALLANDMHLDLLVPNIWYRTTLKYSTLEREDIMTVHGITLPGIPFVIIGSNGSVSWGITNAKIDTIDLVLLQTDENGTYYSKNGVFDLEEEATIINVKGKPPVNHVVKSSPFGPIFPYQINDIPVSVRWTALETDGFNLGLSSLETAGSVEEVMNNSDRIAGPALNLHVIDKFGSIGWSVIGSVPSRVDHHGQVPILSGSLSVLWKNNYAQLNLPKIVNPPNGFLWSANNRVLSDNHGNVITSSKFRNGARAAQIRDLLMENDKHDELSFLDIQLNDEARYLKRWKELFLRALQHSLDIDPDFPVLLELLRKWDGRASANSSAYYHLRNFRSFVATQVLGRILAPCYERDSRFNYTLFDYEEALWEIVNQAPDYLVDETHGSFEAELVFCIQRMLQAYRKRDRGYTELNELKWGNFNISKIRHPVLGGIPLISKLLSMPEVGQSGDSGMPRVSAPTFGASQRLVVNPGDESSGIFQMPGGQSSNPLSKHYGDMHRDWVEGNATSLVPGPVVKTLILKPKK